MSCQSVAWCVPTHLQLSINTLLMIFSTSSKLLLLCSSWSQHVLLLHIDSDVSIMSKQYQHFPLSRSLQVELCSLLPFQNTHSVLLFEHTQPLLWAASARLPSFFHLYPISSECPRFSSRPLPTLCPAQTLCSFPHPSLGSAFPVLPAPYLQRVPVTRYEALPCPQPQPHPSVTPQVGGKFIEAFLFWMKMWDMQ